VDVVFKDVHVSGYMTLQQNINRQLDRLDRLLCSDHPTPVKRVSEYSDYFRGLDVLYDELLSYGWKENLRGPASFVLKIIYENANYMYFCGSFKSKFEACFQFIDYYKGIRNEMAVQIIPFSELIEFINTNNLFNPTACVCQHHPEISPGNVHLNEIDHAETPIIPNDHATEYIIPSTTNDSMPDKILQSLQYDGWQEMPGSTATILFLQKRGSTNYSTVKITLDSDNMTVELNKIATFNNETDWGTFYTRYLAI
jgi:hypothetical protein